jgi:hypothetical protein
VARIRTLKPEFPHSQSMGRVCRESRLCFLLMWTLADDAGRLRGDSRMLASLLYPYDDDAKDHIDGWLDGLEAERCIVRYRIDGSDYIQITNWLIHQKIDKPSRSKIPEFDESSRKVANPREGSSWDQGSKDQRIKGRDQGSEDQSVADATEDAPRGTSNDAIGQQAARVFAHWCATHSHPRAKLDAKRRKLIRAALADYTEADLCLCITGYLNSPHHMGKNDRNTVYDDIEIFLRDAKHIDAGLKFAAEPPRTDLSRQTRQIIDQTAGWKPPEMRHAAN